MVKGHHGFFIHPQVHRERLDGAPAVAEKVWGGPSHPKRDRLREEKTGYPLHEERPQNECGLPGCTEEHGQW